MTVKKIRAALTRKLGPLPVWAWSVIAFAGVYYWRHRNAAASQTATGTGAGVAAGAGSGYYDTGAGGGGGGGDQPLTGSPSDSVGAPVSWDPTQTPAAADPYATPAPIIDTGTDGTDAATSISSLSPGRATISSGGSRPQPFGGQRVAGGVLSTVTGAPALAWGGLVFTTQGQFQTWARLHGTTVRAELARHPAAARIYAQLQPAPAAPQPKRTKAPTRTRSTTSRPAARPQERPVSVRGVPERRVVSHPAAATKKRKAAASRSVPHSKAAAAFTHPSVPGFVQNPVTNPIRAAAPSRTIAVVAPAPAPNVAYRMLNPTPSAPAQSASRTTASAPPVASQPAPTRVAPRSGRMIAE